MSLKVKGLYANGMVLQRGMKNCAFGTADANSQVKLNFRNADFSSICDAEGNWKIEFEVGDAGGPFELKISSGSDEALFKDVYVGEVWVSSGQSNAQLPMSRMYFSYREEFELPENQNIRIITVPITYAFDGEKDSVENPQWNCACPEHLANMAGTSYFFAKKLQSDLGVPIGIINPAQGGSPINSWVNKEVLEKMNQEDFLSTLKIYEDPKNIEDKKASVAKAQGEWAQKILDSDLGLKENWQEIPVSSINNDWSSCTIPGFIDELDSAGIVWLKKSVNLTATQVEKLNSKKSWIWLGTIVDADKVYINGTFVGETAYSYPPRRYVIPAGTLKEGENTITLRVQKNGSWGKVRFYQEKPYYIFTDDVKIWPVATRNVEIPAKKIDMPKDGVLIDISGTWRCKVGCKVENSPEGIFFEWLPTALYNGMLAPCFNHSVRGALWYQGESDGGRWNVYGDFLKNMIALWRQKFAYSKKDFPFIVVQLPNWCDGFDEGKSAVSDGWAELRMTQCNLTRELENVGCAVCLDAGEWNDLHPEKKLTVGTRAAKEALRIAYEKNYSPAPDFDSLETCKKSWIVKYNCFNSELKAFAVKGKAANLCKKGKAIFGFTVLFEKDGKVDFVETKAKLKSNNSVEVSIPKVEGKILELRYLYAFNPAPVNLYSAELIPAESFVYKF